MAPKFVDKILKRKAENQGEERKGAEEQKEKVHKYFDEVPDSLEAWQKYASQANVSTMTLGLYPHSQSGSNVTQKQYLLFRTIRCKHYPEEFKPERFKIEQEVAQAREVVKKSTRFQNYIQSIRDGTYDDDGNDKFDLVRQEQKEILADPPKENIEGPTTIDESPVNNSFLALLMTISGLVPNCRFQWRQTRAHLKAEFEIVNEPDDTKRRKTTKLIGFTAHTDGQLQDRQTYRVKTIMECKVNQRLKCEPDVDMQEAAQMVAWIRQFPSEERQRAIVAQNRDHIYITFAQYNDRWLSYLNTNNVEQTDMLEMTQFGPYRIADADLMVDAAEVLLALVL